MASIRSYAGRSNPLKQSLSAAQTVVYWNTFAGVGPLRGVFRNPRWPGAISVWATASWNILAQFPVNPDTSRITINLPPVGAFSGRHERIRPRHTVNATAPR